MCNCQGWFHDEGCPQELVFWWDDNAQQRSLMSNNKYTIGEYYWLDKEKTILSQCVRIENEVAYFQVIGLSIFYTEKDFEIAIKATVK